MYRKEAEKISLLLIAVFRHHRVHFIFYNLGTERIEKSLLTKRSLLLNQFVSRFSCTAESNEICGIYSQLTIYELVHAFEAFGWCALFKCRKVRAAKDSVSPICQPVSVENKKNDLPLCSL